MFISLLKFVKVWYTSNPSQFMPAYNKARILNFLDDNPKRELTLIFSSTLLNQEGQLDFEDFKHKLQSKYKNFSFVDIDSEVFKQNLISDNERNIYSLIQQELHATRLGGNPAAASDMTRVLKPVLKYGIYTDFDVRIQFDGETNQWNTVFTDATVLWSATKKGLYCNDVIAANFSEVKESDTDKFLNDVQKNIIAAYINFKQKITENFTSIIYISDEQKHLVIKFNQLLLSISIPTSKDNASIFQDKNSLLNSAKQLIRLRSLIENLLQEAIVAQKEQDIAFWLEAFKLSVMYITGPINLKCSLNDSSVFGLTKVSIERTELGKIIQAQLAGASNDASWFPAEVIEYFNHKKLQTSADYQITCQNSVFQPGL